MFDIKDKSIAAVSRSDAFSPNHVGNDAAILNLTVAGLRNAGCKVSLYNEREFVESQISQDVIVNMCREQASLDKLMQLRSEGRLIINDPVGIENCTRERMTRLLIDNGVPHPQSIIVDTDVDLIPILHGADIERCWLKRAEFHAQHKEDVSYCRHPEEAQETLREFRYRGMKRAVINRHLDGDLVKFYGLADGSFFYWFYPLKLHHSKFGDELINGEISDFLFDEKQLRNACEKAASVIGISIYGGDAIIDENGNFQIIDFNDWPSFAPCRDEAGPLIARSIVNAIRKHYLSACL